VIKKRSLTIIIVLGFLMSILFSAVFSFAEEQLTFTAYYPTDGYYNWLNATDLSVANHAQAGGSLGVGKDIPDPGSDLYVINDDKTSSLTLFGRGQVGVGNHDDLILASPGRVGAPEDPYIWAMTHDVNNKLVFIHHSSGLYDESNNPIWRPILTMDNENDMGINTINPQVPLHISSHHERDMIFLDSDSEEGTGILFRNTASANPDNQYFGMGWGGSDANDRSNEFNFWFAGSDGNYTDPFMTFYKNERVGIKNQNPEYTLDVNGGARFDTDAAEYDTGSGISVEGFSAGGIGYNYRSGSLGLSSPVTIRGDASIDGILEVALVASGSPSLGAATATSLTPQLRITGVKIPAYMNADTIYSSNIYIDDGISYVDSEKFYAGNLQCRLCVEVSGSGKNTGHCWGGGCADEYGTDVWTPWLFDNTTDATADCQYRFKFECDQ